MLGANSLAWVHALAQVLDLNAIEQDDFGMPCLYKKKEQRSMCVWPISSQHCSLHIIFRDTRFRLETLKPRSILESPQYAEHSNKLIPNESSPFPHPLLYRSVLKTPVGRASSGKGNT